ncbi:glycine--tRNA ligase [Micromonospora sp. NPDC049240]|uniref:glycine--tRNA ligase n=1 Tax=Micromonospora sp. NPDC049240 TaxID=3155151 RepID=UPI0033D82F0F
MLTMQEALARLTDYWTAQGLLTVQPMNTEVGAGTLNPATFLRVLGPEPWKVVYTEPSVRPDDSRYGENPNRLQTHTQIQVILKPDPGNPQELCIGSLAALGIDVAAHDLRFVEDNWASPALGAWGLGWEVWLDGLEIGQFTYMQQAGGINLEPVAVEITYGIERIIMALQGVRHFKEIEYAPGISYGEVFGQGEYEMSRYYLDDADIATNRRLLELYAAEAQRLIDAGLPVPAHTYVLKCSQTFNVLDSRGAVSTAERATEFARMRRMAAEVARLWVARREEFGFPLGRAEPLPVAGPVAAVRVTDDRPRTLVFEVGTEELPPSEARAARDHLAQAVADGLAGTRLTYGEVRVYATPRRVLAVVEQVAARESDYTNTVRGPRVSAAYEADGSPTKALQGFLRGQNVTIDALGEADFNGQRHVVVHRQETGGTAPEVLATVLGKVVTGLRASKNMRWNDSQLSFTRPIRWLTALWGDHQVPVVAGIMAAGRSTRVLRVADQPVVEVASAEEFLSTLASNGLVVDPAQRRELVVAGAEELVHSQGRVDVAGEAPLIDQIVYLTEAPTPLLGTFDDRYLTLPDAVLTTVMRKHQRYLPVWDADGALLPMFVTVANGPVDVDMVRAGNEAVLRARYEDAAFFYRADRTLSLDTMRDHLDRLTFTDKLGSMADRVSRIGALATSLAADLGLSSPTLDRAADLVKFDLGSQMVTEMTSLAGVMARDYALNAGETEAVAQALYEAELPRNTGDDVPATLPGALLSLADRLDLFAGLAATVGLPTGSSDPFAVRRAVLGLLAVHRAHPELAGLRLTDALAAAGALQPVEVGDDVLHASGEFLAKRFEQVLTEEGHPIDRVRAVLPHFAQPSVADRLLGQLATLATDPEFAAVAQAIQRARRIVPEGTSAGYDQGLLKEPAEVALHQAVQGVLGRLGAGREPDLARFAAETTALVTPLEEFFTDVFVMADDLDVRAARLGLLATVRDLSAGLLDWAHLRL